MFQIINFLHNLFTFIVCDIFIWNCANKVRCKQNKTKFDKLKNLKFALKSANLESKLDNY